MVAAEPGHREETVDRQGPETDYREGLETDYQEGLETAMGRWVSSLALGAQLDCPDLASD